MPDVECLGADHGWVLVWIHGGAFYQGSGGDDFNDGARLAARAGAIVVTINYRLGPLGFLSHRALAREEGRRASPSFGLLDQRAALQWVQRNIAAFGGDPARVTVAGQSAGAWSVCAQLTSPGGRGLFTRAIMESGACSDALYSQPGKAEQQGDALAAAVGCTGAGVLECLRARSPDELVAALPHERALILHPGVWWGPVIDGVELPEVPLDAMRTGAFAQVPLLIGWNRDEGTASTVSLDAVSATDVADFVADSFGEAAVNPVSARYVRSTAKLALTDIVTDGVFACGARRVARASAARAIPTFLYLWTRALDAPSHHALGATHGVELFFLWGNAFEWHQSQQTRGGAIGDPDANVGPLRAYRRSQRRRFALAPHLTRRRRICDPRPGTGGRSWPQTRRMQLLGHPRTMTS